MPFDGTFGAFCKVIRPSERVYPGYLGHFFRTSTYRKRVSALAAGANINNLKNEHLDGLELKLPPLREQRRVTAILDQADDLRRLRNRAIDALTRLQEATLSLAQTRAGPNMPAVTLSDVLAEVQIGPFGTLLHKSDYVSGGIPLVNPMHIMRGRIVPDPTYSVSTAKLKELERYVLRVGDIVMARRGEMGRCALVGPADAGFLCGTGSMVLRVDKDKADAGFLADYIGTPEVIAELESVSAGVTMANLNQQSLRAVKARIPPLSEQKKYSASKAKIEDQRKVTYQSLGHLDDLFSSLQHRAFAGEI
jgi:type I restriction enzyme S subunit